MNKEFLLPEDFMRCAEFHGHICPGLTIGYRAAKAGLDYLSGQRSVDEEIVAVTETDACCVDAIQVLTGCTFGKGNLVYRDHGKMVFTFFSRSSGEGVRISIKLEVMASSEEYTGEEEFKLQKEKKFPEFHPQKTRRILEKSVEEIFKIEPVNIELPPRAKIEISELCAFCKEPTMSSKLKELKGNMFCSECFMKKNSLIH